MNASHKLSPRFRDSRDDIHEAQSGTFESAMSEPSTPSVIRIVDMSKSGYMERNFVNTQQISGLDNPTEPYYGKEFRADT